MTKPPTKYWCEHGLRFHVEGPEGAEEITVERPFALIGSHDKCDVVLAPSDIPSRLAYLHATKQGIYLLSLRKDESLHGPSRWLQPGETWNVGPYRIQVSRTDNVNEGAPPAMPLDARESAAKPWPQLVFRCWDKVIAERMLDAPLTLVGRSRPSRIRIRHARISSCHCVFYQQVEKLWVIDLRSTNHTLVNGRPRHAARVRPGDTLQLDEVEVSVVAGSPETLDDVGLDESVEPPSETKTAEFDSPSPDALDLAPPAAKMPPVRETAARREDAEPDAKQLGTDTLAAPLLSSPTADDSSSEELEHLRRRVRELEEQDAVLRSRLDNAQENAFEIEEEASQLRIEQKRLQQSLDERTAEVERLTAELQAERKSRPEQSEKLEKLRQELESKIAELESQKQEAEDARRQLEEEALPLRQERDELREALARAQQQFEESTSKAAADETSSVKLQRELDEARATIATLEQQAEDSARTFAERERQVAELQAAGQQQQQALEENGRQQDEVTRRVEQLESALAERDHQLTELRARTDEQQGVLAASETVRNESEGRLAELQSALRERDDELTELRGRLEESEKQLDASQGRERELESLRGELERQRQELEDQQNATETKAAESSTASELVEGTQTKAAFEEFSVRDDGIGTGSGEPDRESIEEPRDVPQSLERPEGEESVVRPEEGADEPEEVFAFAPVHVGEPAKAGKKKDSRSLHASSDRVPPAATWHDLDHPGPMVAGFQRAAHARQSRWLSWARTGAMVLFWTAAVGAFATLAFFAVKSLIESL